LVRKASVYVATVGRLLECIEKEYLQI